MHSLSSEAEAYSVAQVGYELRVTSLPNVCERRALALEDKGRWISELQAILSHAKQHFILPLYFSYSVYQLH